MFIVKNRREFVFLLLLVNNNLLSDINVRNKNFPTKLKDNEKVQRRQHKFNLLHMRARSHTHSHSQKPKLPSKKTNKFEYSTFSDMVICGHDSTVK